MTWFKLTGDERLTQRCATDDCAGQVTERLEADGVGANYCSGCRAKIENAGGHLMAEITNEHRKAVYLELLSDDYKTNSAMLIAAGNIPLERENGGIEYPPIKVFREMLIANARERGIEL